MMSSTRIQKRTNALQTISCCSGLRYSGNVPSGRNNIGRQTYHRFLWRGIQQNRPPDVFEFDRVVLGVNSSPFQAQFILQHLAKKDLREFPAATETSQIDVHGRFRGLCAKRGAGHQLI